MIYGIENKMERDCWSLRCVCVAQEFFECRRAGPEDCVICGRNLAGYQTAIFLE